MTHSKTLRRLPEGAKRALKATTARRHRRKEKSLLQKALRATAPNEVVNFTSYKRNDDPWNYD